MDPSSGAGEPSRRRDARLLVAPFLEAVVAPHFEGQRGRAPREIVQDLSTRGLSFFTANADLIGQAHRIDAVTVECPDGLAATLGVATAHVRSGQAGLGSPVRMALEFEHPRPPIRITSAVQRLADGLFAPKRRADAARLVRALLGADPEARERRRAERIRVPLEDEIRVHLERAGAVVGEALLADVSSHGFGCIAPEDFQLSGAVEEVRLVAKGRELVRRAVRDVFVDRRSVRGQPRTQLRVVIAPPPGAADLNLPLWVGAHEFGSVRLRRGGPGAELVQAALLARTDVRIVEARTPEERDAAADLSYEAFMGEGDVVAARCPRSAWSDDFESRATVLLARAGDLIAGTIRLVPDGPGGLPFQQYAPEEVWPRPSSRRAEGGRLAVSRAYRQDVNARLGLGLLLIARDVQMAQVQGVERILIGVRLSHARFYRAIGFEPISHPFVHLQFGLEAQLLEIGVASPGPLRKFMR
ncbi:MAG: hypothetical protein HYY06_19205 [Deltaproteobacteria bacterium]|nr:hypothetical protein [Deltaproteobacteria bacterium]